MVVPQGGATADLLQRQAARTLDVARGAILEQQGQRVRDIPQELGVTARLAGLGRAAGDLACAQAVAVVAVADGAGGSELGHPVGLVVGEGVGLANTGRDGRSGCPWCRTGRWSSRRGLAQAAELEAVQQSSSALLKA